MDDLEYLISYLSEKTRTSVRIPDSLEGRLALYRSLMRNVSFSDIDDEYFFEVQDRFLQTINRTKEPVSVSDMSPVSGNIYVWNGSIARLAVDAVVNCTGEEFLGSFSPCCQCIDDALEFYCGPKLKDTAEHTKAIAAMDSGSVIITPAFNLPAKYIITAGGDYSPKGILNEDEEIENLYMGCLHLAWLNGVKSIAFAFALAPLDDKRREKAAEAAVSAVKNWLDENKNYPISVVFCVFNNEDGRLFERLIR